MANSEAAKRAKARYRERHRDKLAAYARKYRATKENKQRKRESQQRWRKANPERATWYQRLKRLRKAGVVDADKAHALLAAFDGFCAICTAPCHPCVDHDHKTGRIRGLICNDCNVGLGRFYDSPRALERAAAYLRKPPAQNANPA